MLNADLSNVPESVALLSRFEPDMIIGGPPCQDFSQAGKRNEDNGRGDLTVAYAQLIATMKPKYFLMENVDRIVKTGKFSQAMKIWKEAGYGLTPRLLDASYCGVPQKRKRFVVLGILDGEDNAVLPYILKNLSDSPMTVRDYFGDELGTEYYYRHPRNYERRAIYSLDEPSATIRGVNRPIPLGYPGHKNDAISDRTQARPLTTVERSWVQTFPKDFVWEGPKTHVEQMIGNAVPVNLAEFVATCLREYIEAQEARAPTFDSASLMRPVMRPVIQPRVQVRATA
jgi:DNA (cytosine-5)-methyltransferase 1